MDFLTQIFAEISMQYFADKYINLNRMFGIKFLVKYMDEKVHSQFLRN